MKIELIEQSDWYSRTTYSSGTVRIQRSEKIDDFSSEESEEEIQITIIETTNDDMNSTFDITFVDDLPEGVNEDEVKNLIIKQL